MNSVVIPLGICASHKTRYRMGKGNFYLSKEAQKDRQDLIAYLSQLEPTPPTVCAINARYRVSLGQQTVQVWFEPDGPYILGKHPDLSGIIEAINDAAQDSRFNPKTLKVTRPGAGIIYDDSRIVSIEAKIV